MKVDSDGFTKVLELEEMKGEDDCMIGLFGLLGLMLGKKNGWEMLFESILDI